jgi:hypothetical protein
LTYILCKMQSIVRDISLCLPCDVSRNILQMYTRTYLLPELLNCHKVKQSIATHSLLDNTYQALDKYIEKIIKAREVSNEYLAVCIDILEDRILEDEWCIFGNAQQSLKVLEITKENINTPHVIKREIDTMFIVGVAGTVEASRILRPLHDNINMLCKMLHR